MTWISPGPTTFTAYFSNIDPDVFDIMTGRSQPEPSISETSTMTDKLTLTEDDFAVLTKFQNVAHANARAKGFHDVADRMKAYAEAVRVTDPEVANLIISNHYGNRLLLIVGEAIEAQEELRHGHAADEEYIVNGKPEGMPSEVNDIQIRAADLAGEIGMDSGRGLALKMGFNSTRERLHGGKSF